MIRERRTHLTALPETPAGVVTPPSVGPARIGWGPFLPLLIAVGLMTLAGLRDWGPGGEDIPWVGALVVFLGLMPGLHWMLARSAGSARADRVGAIPFLPVIGGLFALYFGVPTLLGDDFTTPTLQHTTESVVTAVWLAAGGWIALLLGWRLSEGPLRHVPPLQLHLDPDRTRRATPLLLTLGFLAFALRRTVPLPGGLEQPMRFVEMLFQIGIGITALRSFQGRLSRNGNLFLWLGLVPVYLFLQVGIGSVAQLAYAGAFLLFLAWGAGRRVPLVALGMLGLSVFLLRGHVHAFREATWENGRSSQEYGAWEKSVLFVEILAERFSDGGGEVFSEAADQVGARVSHLGSFSHVTALTPSRVEHWGGASYAALPTTVIPRALWPGKPSKQVGQDFGHRYELLAPKDRTTAFNLPQIVELYANFGAAGVLAGMLALGVIYRFLQRWWNTPGTGEGTLLLACLLMSRLILIESDFTLVYGALIQNSVLLVLVFRWLGGPRRSAPREPALALSTPAEGAR